jgi:hypothetical protein
MKPYILMLLAPATVLAQKSTYTQAPKLPTAATLTVPVVRSGALPNGVRLNVVEQHELPLVQVTLTVTGGSRLDGDTSGIATFMANMLDEGAGTRDALALQSELAYLGANLSTTADWDRVTVGLKVPVRALPAALALMADVALRPTFRAEEVRRQRDLRLTALLQAKDQPNTLASLAFNQAVFPANHPYARNATGDSAIVASYDSALVRRFYEGAVRPERATLFIVGDVNEAQVRTLMTQAFGSWRANGTATPLPTVPAAVAAPATRWASTGRCRPSVIIVGWPGVERTRPIRCAAGDEHAARWFIHIAAQHDPSGNEGLQLQRQFRVLVPRCAGSVQRVVVGAHERHRQLADRDLQGTARSARRGRDPGRTRPRQGVRGAWDSWYARVDVTGCGRWRKSRFSV